MDEELLQQGKSGAAVDEELLQTAQIGNVHSAVCRCTWHAANSGPCQPPLAAYGVAVAGTSPVHSVRSGQWPSVPLLLALAPAQ